MKIRVTTEEAGKMLNLTKKQVLARIHKGELDAVRIGKLRLMVSMQSIHELMLQESNVAIR